MALTYLFTKEVEVPHEPGNFFTFRRVRREFLQRAADVRQKQAIDKLRDLGGAAFMREMQQLHDAPVAVDGNAPNQDVKKPTSDRFDIDVLIAHGLTAWRGPLYDGHSLNEAAVAELDQVTADWAAGVIERYADGQEITEGNA